MAFKWVPQWYLGQQYNVGERPTVILYTYINRHAGPPNNKTEDNKGSNNIEPTMITLI